MKRLFLSLKTSGYNPELSGVSRLSGIIDIDSTIMEIFDIPCKLFPFETIRGEAVGLYEASDESTINREEGLNPFLAITRLKEILNKYVDIKNNFDKFHLISYNGMVYEFMFFERFFMKNRDSSFNKYFWYPPLDVVAIASFILDGYKRQLIDLRLGSLANFFGFKIVPDSKELFDTSFRVNMMRDIFYFLNKFKNPVVILKKATRN